MDTLLKEFIQQLKAQALLITILFGCFSCLFLINRKMEDANSKIEEANRNTNSKIEEANRNIEGLGQTIHLIERQLPESIVHILLTPSQASNTKDANLQSLLNILFITFPSILDKDKPSKKHFSKFKFEWVWRNQPESSVYKPFVDAVSDNLLRLNVEIYDVSGGQLLYNQLLYTTELCSLRVLDAHGRKTGAVYYKGQIRGRTDLVVVDKEGPWTFILRHNVRFVIEVKLPLKSKADLSSAFRDAMTQLLGLCGDNPRRSPPVLLTDFVGVFIVLSLSKPSRIPLKFEINAYRFPDIASAMSSAYELSMQPGISEDLGRNNTPDGSRDEDD